MTPPLPPAALVGDARRPLYFYSVPRVGRGECFNAGVVVSARSLRYLGIRWALAPEADPDFVESQLIAMAGITAGADDGGPVATLDVAERVHWLSAPSSTMIQPSPVHIGVPPTQGRRWSTCLEP